MNSWWKTSFQFTEQGALEHAQMKGLKNYIEDYSLLHEANPSLIHLWGKYFVYGLSVGVTEKTLKELYKKLPASKNLDESMMFQYNVMNQMLQNDIIVNTESLVQITTINSFSESASFGDGGGFSSGGGSGAGGGGGHSF